MSEKNPYVVLIMLNYRGYSDTIECVESVLRNAYDNYSIILLDNDSRDLSYEKFVEKYRGEQKIQVVQTGRNYGFAGGNNVGIRMALEQHADYICIINNDVVVERDFLTEMVKKIESDKSLAAVGPCIGNYYNRKEEKIVGAFMSLRTGMGGYYGENSMSPQSVSSPKHTLFYLPGCCMLIRTECIQQCGIFPECYFLFFEETEWCLHVQEEGYHLACVEGSVIWHKESASMSENSEFKKHFLEYNRILFMKRNHSKGQFTIFCVYYLIQYWYRKFTKSKEQNSMKLLRLVMIGKEEETYGKFYRG